MDYNVSIMQNNVIIIYKIPKRDNCTILVTKIKSNVYNYLIDVKILRKTVAHISFTTTLCIGYIPL